MDKKYWRISYQNKGIYEALKQVLYKDFNSEIWNQLKSSEAFTWLRVPDNYYDNCLSYFTEFGFNIFMEKTYPILLKYLNEYEIKIESLTFNYLKLNIIYEDEHQIVIKA